MPAISDCEAGQNNAYYPIVTFYCIALEMSTLFIQLLIFGYAFEKAPGFQTKPGCCRAAPDWNRGTAALVCIAALCLPQLPVGFDSLGYENDLAIGKMMLFPKLQHGANMDKLRRCSASPLRKKEKNFQRQYTLEYLISFIMGIPSEKVVC